MRSKNQEVMENIVKFVDEYFLANNTVPTMQEIADKVGIAKSNVSRYMKEMKEKGLIELSPTYRGVRTKTITKTLQDIYRVPVVGNVACGTPILAEQNIDNYLTISSAFLGQGNFFALRAKGDSMVKADINDGDFVIVKQQSDAEDGQIIVALVEDSATLKRFYKDTKKHMIRLHPENDTMEDMYFDKIEIQGVVKKVVKDIE